MPTRSNPRGHPEQQPLDPFLVSEELRQGFHLAYPHGDRAESMVLDLAKDLATLQIDNREDEAIRHQLVTAKDLLRVISHRDNTSPHHADARVVSLVKLLTIRSLQACIDIWRRAKKNDDDDGGNDGFDGLDLI